MEKKLKVDQETKRHLVLDLAKIIADSGDSGIQISELVKSVKSEFDDKYIIGVIKRDLVNCLGKNNIIRGERRWARYVIDDLTVAVNLINDYFDRKKNDLQIWQLYADIAEYIRDTPAVTDKMVAEEFGVDTEFLDDMNSALAEYSTSLDFYKITSNGVRVRLNVNTLTVIRAKINDLTPKVDKVETKKHLTPLPDEHKKMIQERLLHIMYYLGDSTNIAKIIKLYSERFSEDLKDITIHSLMDKVPGINHYNNLYTVKDVNIALEHINPVRSVIRLEFAMKRNTNSRNVLTYENVRYSRELGDYDIYILEDKNSYSIINQIIDLLLIGASIDSSVVKRVQDIVRANMSIGHKVLL